MVPIPVGFPMLWSLIRSFFLTGNGKSVMRGYVDDQGGVKAGSSWLYRRQSIRHIDEK
jgi:hypothetical protein